MDFSVAADMFVNYIRARTSKGMYEYSENKAKILKEYFKNQHLDEIDQNEVVSFIVHTRERNPEITNHTINKYIAVLKRIIKYHTKRELEFDKLPQQKKVIQIIQDDVISQVLDYLKKNFRHKEAFRNYVFFKLLLDTGLRLSELLHLKSTNVDFNTKTIHVTRTKTGNERYVFFADSTRRSLMRLISLNNEEDYIFVNYKGGKRLSVNNVQHICKRIQATLKLRQSISPHKWRHTFATKFLKQGGDLEVLRLILGHSNLRTTQIYLHLDPQHLHEQYFKIQKDLFQD